MNVSSLHIFPIFYAEFQLLESPLFYPWVASVSSFFFFFRNVRRFLVAFNWEKVTVSEFPPPHPRLPRPMLAENITWIPSAHSWQIHLYEVFWFPTSCIYGCAVRLKCKHEAVEAQVHLTKIDSSHFSERYFVCEIFLFPRSPWPYSLLCFLSCSCPFISFLLKCFPHPLHVCISILLTPPPGEQWPNNHTPYRAK